MYKLLAVAVLSVSVVSLYPPTPREPQGDREQKQPASQIQNRSDCDQRGTPNSPFVITVLPSLQADNETTKGQNKRDRYSTDWWMFGATIIIAIIGAIQTRVFWVQATRLKETIQKMDEISKQQTADIKASIAAANESATAMKGIAESLASSVEISREIASTQKLVTELQSRPYLYASFNTATFQDENHVFEVQAILRNHGNTPAYDVTFSATAEIVPSPLPDDFAFPLPSGTAGASVSLMAPGTTKIIRRVVASRVPDEQVESIKRGGPPRCLGMWGVVSYRDAFMKTRELRFAFTMFWQTWIEGKDRDKDGNLIPEQIFSIDTAHHNSSD
jgi:hypothetical protein